MIVQVLHSFDSSLLQHLSKKYSVPLTILNSNYFIEIREVPKIVYHEAKLFLEDFIQSKTLFPLEFDEQYYHLLFIVESLTRFSNKLQELTIIKNNVLVDEILSFIANYFSKPEIRIGEKVFSADQPLLMGILNVTPDSFSDGGKYFNPDIALTHALEMIQYGADIIDIGGESSRPGSEPVTAEEEIKRIIPVIEKILIEKPDAIISVDTYKSRVAEEALKTGAKLINDISGFTFDPDIADVCAKFHASAILMHIKGTPKTMQLNPLYDEVVSEIYDFLKRQTDFAKSKGIKDIIIDPGIGFGKSVKDNFTILKRLKDFNSLGYPILIGVSRKSLIGKTLNLEIENRDLPSAVLEAISLFNSARIIRTHNVKNGKQIIKLLREII